MNDETPNTPETPETPETEEAPTNEGSRRNEEVGADPPRRLRRSADDRVLLGVAGGLGRYFRIDPVIVRIGFALSVFFGGLGALAYLLLAIFVPTEGDPDRVQRFGGRVRSLGFWRAVGVVAVAALAVSGLFGLAGVAAFGVAVGWGVPIAITVIAIGAVLALTALRGGARWLIPPALAVAIGAGVAMAADIDWSGGIGDREYQPLTAAAIPSEGYRLGVGRLVVDLRKIAWNRDRVVPVKVHLGAGQANVFVPARVCVTGETQTGVGESEVAGERSDGVGLRHPVGDGARAVPRLVLDADVDVGQLRVINSDVASVDNPGYGPGPFHEDTAPLRAAEARACVAR